MKSAAPMTALARVLVASALLLPSRAARASETASVGSVDAERPGYTHLFGTLAFGTGLRFNNPYRLATPLGDTAESVSRTATYADLGVGFTMGSVRGFQHGMTLRTSIATEGVGQAVLGASYVLYRRKNAFAGFGRLGIPLVVGPSVTWGAETGIGGIWFARGGIGLTAEVIGDLFYGAATAERRITTYPVLSGQLGIVFDYEVLP